MLSKNEWDSLKTVIVGSATNAKIPFLDKSLRTVNYADIENISDIKIGNYPEQVIEEANQDLEIFTNFLESQSVSVLRPEKDADPLYYNYCPRDGVFVFDNLILSTPQPLQSRQNEEKFIEKHFFPYTKEKKAEYVKRTISGQDNLYNEQCIGNPDILSLTETEPCFDAANILRANDHLLYLVSNSGNKKGAELLQELVGKDIKVSTLEGVYSYMHIDSTLAFLREGLMLLNPDRIKDIHQLPEPFNKWDYIWCPEPVDIGYYPGYKNASKWISMNLFSINPNLVALEQSQIPLQRKLEKYKIECAMLPMRHARTLSGCFHCVTLDLERDD